MIKGKAIVVKNAGSHFYLSELPQWQPFAAVLRGKVRLNENSSTNPIAVGDEVSYEFDDSLHSEPCETHPATITAISHRKNHLVRKSTNLSRQSHCIAANLDRVVLICTLYFPELKLPFLDRQLVSCEMYKIPVTIVLNKVDLIYELLGEEGKEALEDFVQLYTNAGYQVMLTSTKTGEGIDELRELCKGKLNLLSGESGVGKSSIIKSLDNSLNPKIADISLTHLQGKHTTSLYEMYPLSSGGYIIDTPGLRAFGLHGLEKEEIATYFPEMLAITDNCRFIPCTHTHEPGCAIKQALEDGQIDRRRYNSYLGMLQEDSKFR